MKKFLKVAVVVILLVAVVMGVASVLLHVILPPAKAKALILKQLTGHLHREVTVGSVSVGVISGVRLMDLKVSESPDFNKGTFLSSDVISLHLALTPLLFRKIEAQVLLTHPEVTIVRFADGKTFNFSDLTTAPTAQVSTPAPSKTATLTVQKPGAPPFDLLISRAEIDKGIIHFTDRSPAQQSIEINPLDLKLKNVSLTATFGVQTSLKAQMRGHDIAFELNGQANLAEGDFTAKSCELSSADSTLRVTGHATQLKTPHPAADLKIDLDPFDPTPWRPFLSLPPEMHWAGSMVAHAHIKGDENKMEITVQTDLTKVQLAYGKMFSKPAKVPFTAVVSGTLTKMQNLDFDTLQATLGTLKIAAHGSVNGITSIEPSVSLHVESNSMPMREIGPYIAGALPSTLSLNGSSKLTADVSGTIASCRVAAKWQAQDLVVTMGNTFSKPAGIPLEVTFIGELLRPPSTGGVSSQTINFQTLAGTLGPVEWSGDGSYKTVGRKSDVTLAVKTNSFSIGDLAHLVPMLAAYHPTGHVAVDARVSGSADAPVANGAAILEEMGAQYQNSEVAAMNGTVNFTQQDVGTQKLVGKLNGSDFSIQLTGHKLQTQPDIHLDATFAELDLNKLLPPSTPPASTFNFTATPAEAAPMATGVAPLPMKLSGHLAVGKIQHPNYQGQSLDLKWNLADVTPDLAHISGTATLRQGPGHLLNIDKLASQSRAAKVMLLPILTLQKMDTNGVLKGMGIPSLQDIPFDTLKGDYVMQPGVTNVKDFDLTGQVLALETQGSIGMTGLQVVNLAVTMKLQAGSVGGTMGQILQDENGRPTLQFTVTGPASAPKVHLDLHEAGQKAVKQLLNAFLGGNAPASAPAPAGGDANATPPPASNNNPNPAADLQKALKNIFH